MLDASHARLARRVRGIEVEDGRVLGRVARAGHEPLHDLAELRQGLGLENALDEQVPVGGVLLDVSVGEQLDSPLDSTWKLCWPSQHGGRYSRSIPVGSLTPW